MKSELVYAPDGTITGVRHAWTFDDMFSTFATQGLESKKKGEFTREELAPLAKVNVKSLKEYDYLHARHGERQEGRVHRSAEGLLSRSTKRPMLTLHFTLPFKTPVKAQGPEDRGLRPDLFRRLRLAEKDAGRARRRAARLQARRSASRRRWTRRWRSG